ncbi:MAG: hypothetical protein LRZ84_20015 [Desertifilum sp.]|nr:hypothetical protein [Desertifilum sp.]
MKISLKSLKLWLPVAAINLLLIAVLVEIVSLAFYGINQKQLFYTSPTRRASLIPDEVAPQDIGDNEITQIRIHPFIGYLKKHIPVDKIGYNINNFGFTTPYDYPFQRQNQEQFIIGIFGGSVAANLAHYEQEKQVITKALQELPELANREIIVLPFARGGYKQTQTLMILTYFLALGQDFDLIVNVDGFNELAIASVNNQNRVAISMPNIQTLKPLIDLGSNNLSVEAMRLTLQARSTQQKLAKTRQNISRCAFASCYTFNSLYYQYLQGKNGQYQLQLANQTNASDPSEINDSIVFIDRTETVLPDAQLYKEVANLWYNSSLLMKGMASEKGIRYFHFLQPNQYYPTQRVFSSEERKIAILDNHPYGQVVTQGYPLLIEKIDVLRLRQVNTFNAVNIFDSNPEMMYSDNCCHYTEAGNQAFAQYIAEQIKRTF